MTVKKSSLVFIKGVLLMLLFGVLDARTFQAGNEECVTEPSTPTTEAPVPPSSSTCPCGQRKVSRIVGGNETVPNEFPWQAALKTTSDFQFCGGSLIASQWVMTAAHCVDGATADQIIVGLGEHDKTDNDAFSQDFTVSEIIMANYDSSTIDNDVALLKLSSPVTYTDAISPVCLPFTQGDILNTGDLVTVSGWGATWEEGSTTDVLMKVDLNYISPCDCRDNSQEYFYWVTPNMICAHDTDMGACYGDSGGPLVAEDVDGSYYVYGIVSWGYGCGSSYPSVFAKVTNYLDWIEQQTGAQFCIPSAP